MFFALTSPVSIRFKFCKDCQNPQSMLILNLFCFYSNFASKGFKNGYKYFWAYVCVYEALVLDQSPESRKNLTFLNYFFKKMIKLHF
jgi:hypothetical protein